MFSIQLAEKEVNFKNYFLSGTTLTNITPSSNSTEALFLSNIALGSGSTTLFGNLVNGKIGTGSTLEISNITTTTYTILIYGDVTGDGDIAIADLAAIKQHMLNITPLTSTRLTAGKVFRNSAITISDLLGVKKQILGLATISQS